MNVRRMLLLLTLIIVLGTALGVPVNAQPDLTGEWRGEIERNQDRWDVWIHIGQQSEPSTVKVSFPDWGMFLLGTNDVDIDNGKLSFYTDWIDSRFEGEVTGDSMQAVWTFSSGEAYARLYRSADEPGILRTEPITLQVDDGASLRGMLILPDGPPPYAGMVMTHGSGPDTRRTGPYVSKANLAAMNGIATLVYDKRGAGESTGTGAYQVDRLAADAEAMIAHLRSDPRIDQDRIGIGGISQGGWVAPKVAAADSQISFVFVVAAPGVSPAEQNVFSMETRLEAQGGEPEKIEDAKRGLRALYEFYRTGADADRQRAVKLISDSEAEWAQSPIFQRLTFAPEGKIHEEVDVADWATMFVDPLTWWRQIDVPVISFWGEDDTNVPTRYSRDVIEAALREAGNSAFELHLYPGAGHGITMQVLPEGTWPRTAPGYVSTMALWFAEQAGRPKSIPD